MKTAKKNIDQSAARDVVRLRPADATPALFTAALAKVDGACARVVRSGKTHDASIDPSVHPDVLRGALERNERVLVERADDGGLVVVGALRTQPTPGIDVADSYVIEAKKIELRAHDELSLSAEAAFLVLRALGEVETYADRIVSRAETVHKIVGRMLRLN